MTLGELIALTRLRLDDIEEPYLWSDEFLTDSLNRAQVEAAERSYLLRDSTSPLTTIDYLAGQAKIAIDPRILYVEKVHATGRDRQLLATSANELERGNPGWVKEVAPVSECYIRDEHNLILVPSPLVAGTLSLTVIRKPLLPMVSEDDSPEIADEFHEPLVHFAIAEAYSHNDADGEAYPRVKEYEQRFTDIFRRRRKARFTRMQQDHVKNSTIYMRRFN